MRVIYLFWDAFSVLVHVMCLSVCQSTKAGCKLYYVAYVAVVPLNSFNTRKLPQTHGSHSREVKKKPNKIRTTTRRTEE